MAKIQEQLIAIKLSKVARDTDDDSASLLDAETTDQIETIIQELAGNAVVVEIIKD